MSVAKERRNQYRRYQTLARSLDARAFANRDGRLLIVRGDPDFERLKTCLARCQATSPENLPTPIDLGFAAISVSELTPHGLQTRSRALTKWERALAAELHHWPNRKRVQAIADEMQEIGTLRRRCSELHQWHRAARSDGLAQTVPYLLESHQAQRLGDALARREGHKRLPPHAVWYARIVCWIAGQNALERYLNAVEPLLAPDAEFQHLERIRKFRQYLYVLKRRYESEHGRTLHAELRQFIADLPAKLVAQGQFTARLRGRSLVEHCDLLLARCARLLDQYHEIPNRRIPAAMAALAACDGAQSPLPGRLVQECLKTGDCNIMDRSVMALYDERKKPAYDMLLWALDRLESLPAWHEYECVRIMLCGATLEDISWAQREDLVGWFDLRCRTPRWLRSVLDELGQCGITLEPQQLSAVLHAASNPAGVAAVDQFVRWLRLTSRSTWTPKTRELVTKGLVDWFAPGLSKLACHSRLNGWLNPPKFLRQPIDPAIFKLPFLHKCVRRIHFYQRLSRSDVSLPKSLRKRLDQRDRQAGERIYLQQLSAEGRADARQLARLKHLNDCENQHVTESRQRLLRIAEEVYLVTALDALRRLLHDAADDTWCSVAGHPAPDCSLKRLISFADWAGRMNADEQRLLRDILEAQRQYGPIYKRYLPANDRWLKKAEARGLRIGAWLQGETWLTEIEGQRVRVAVEYDPVRVFLMGSYFNTCLSLGDCNEMAVLANAYDANKQVVFMDDGKGRPLARQLVAVSDKFELLGYHCYAAAGRTQEVERDQCIAVMASFCGRWARQCGLPLGNAGEPESIADHFWYDDGTWSWHEAAQRAWEAKANAIASAIDCSPEGAPNCWPVAAGVSNF